MLGPPRPAILAGSGAALGVLCFIAVVVPIWDGGTYRSYLGYMTFLAVFGWALLAGATSRIVGDGSDLLLVNWATSRRIPAAEIRAVTGRNGVVVSTTSGPYGSVAYASSVAQVLFPSSRFARAAARVEAWVQAAPTASGAHLSPVPVGEVQAGRHRAERLPAHPRTLLVVGFPVALTIAQALGVLMWLNTDAIARLIGR